MTRNNWQPNRLERFIIGAPFWLRFLIVLSGVGVLGVIIGSVEGISWLVDVWIWR